MRKKDEIASKLKELWKVENPTIPPIVTTNSIISCYEDIYNIQKMCIDTKSKIRIESVELYPSDIQYYCELGSVRKDIISTIKFINDSSKTDDIYPVTPAYNEIKSSSKKAPLIYAITNRTGIFKITLTNNQYCYFAQYEIGYGKFTAIESVVICDFKTATTFRELQTRKRAQQEKPKIGIYDIAMTDYGITYNPLSFTDYNQIIHPQVDVISNDIELHFNRLTERKYHDRSILLYSMPGTGKTEFIKNIANKYKTTHCIVFCRGIDAMFKHQILAAKYKVPTLIILEEFEESVSAFNQNANYNRVNSSVKNLLSGAFEMVNKGGCYKIFTTNYPDRIDPTILHRKQRIDRLINFGPLENDYALDCAKLYLGDDLYNSLISESNGREELLNLINNLPGVDIKSLCEEFISSCDATETDKTISTLSGIKSLQTNELKSVYKFAAEQEKIFDSIVSSAKQSDTNRLGFTTLHTKKQ